MDHKRLSVVLGLGVYLATHCTAPVVAFADWCSNVQVREGELDPTFGTQGAALGSNLVDGQRGAIRIHHLNTTPDGGALVSGYIGIDPFQYFPTYAGHATILVFDRFEANGSPKLDFGTNGRLILNIAPPGMEELPNVSYIDNEVGAHSTRIQSDGKIVFVSNLNVFTTTGRLEWLVIGRLMPDGSFDQAFGQGGLSFVNPLTIPDAVPDFQNPSLDIREVTPGVHEYVIGVDIAPEPESGDVLPRKMTIFKVNDSGAQIPSFGQGGAVILDSVVSPELRTGGQEARFDHDGKILVLLGEDDFDNRVQVRRFHANGELDQSFGTQGVFSIAEQPNQQNISGRALGIQSDGRIIITGAITPYRQVLPQPPFQDYFTTRITATGTLDPTFGDGFLNRYDSGYYNEAFDLAISPDDDVLVTGNASICGPQCLALAYTGIVNYSLDGIRRTTFGENGAVLRGLRFQDGVIVPSDTNRNSRAISIGRNGTAYTVADTSIGAGYVLERTVAKRCAGGSGSSSSASSSSGSSVSSSSPSSSSQSSAGSNSSGSSSSATSSGGSSSAGSASSESSSATSSEITTSSSSSAPPAGQILTADTKINTTVTFKRSKKKSSRPFNVTVRILLQNTAAQIQGNQRCSVSVGVANRSKRPRFRTIGRANLSSNEFRRTLRVAKPSVAKRNSRYLVAVTAQCGAVSVSSSTVRVIVPPSLSKRLSRATFEQIIKRTLR